MSDEQELQRTIDALRQELRKTGNHQSTQLTDPQQREIVEAASQIDNEQIRAKIKQAETRLAQVKAENTRVHEEAKSLGHFDPAVEKRKKIAALQKQIAVLQKEAT